MEQFKSDCHLRELAFGAIRDIYRNDAYSDVALERVFQSPGLSNSAKNLVCELVYGVVRRQRYLDRIIDQLGKKKARQQPPDLRIILHLGLYQLTYLEKVVEAIAVSSSVELARKYGLGKLTGVVNGLLRAYQKSKDQIELPQDPIYRLGTFYSFPDCLIETWVKEIGIQETEKLCQWFNQSPSLDLRINPLKTSREEVFQALKAVGLNVTEVPGLPQALRIHGSRGTITALPGYEEGWWMVQDSSAQLVTHLLNPQPGETIIDACAAPGGKTTHIAELMGDKGQVWAGDRHQKRLNKIKANAQRLHLTSISCQLLDSTSDTFATTAERVLVDAPCSGNGTLHKRPDLRWRQTPEQIQSLTKLQQSLLTQAATWVKPGGVLVYATCTLNPAENEEIVTNFLANHPEWVIQSPETDSYLGKLATPQGWIKIWPHQVDMDGFFLVKLKNSQVIGR